MREKGENCKQNGKERGRGGKHGRDTRPKIKLNRVGKKNRHNYPD